MISTFNNTFATHGWRYANTEVGGGWTPSRNGTGVDNGNNNWGNVSNGGFCASFDGTNYGINRFWFHFDLTNPASGITIPTNATITGAFLRVVGTNTTNSNTNSDSICIVASSTSSNITLTNSNWGDLGSTAFSTLAMSAYVNNGNNDMTLDASGKSAVQTAIGGVVKFGGRTLRDINNQVPTQPGNMQTFSGTGLLSVTYTVPLVESNDNYSFFM